MNVSKFEGVNSRGKISSGDYNSSSHLLAFEVSSGRFQYISLVVPTGLSAMGEGYFILRTAQGGIGTFITAAPV